MALAANLRRFLADLRAQRRRAVLVVDEAQNLHPDALDQLVALAMRGAPGGRGMQICLVGQPELQTMMGTADLLAVREQICVSCHLGPIERDETGAYVEHRLRKVGWKGSPGFDAGAFDEIYRWTGGIPRRINMLCSRLLSAHLAGDATRIAAAVVAKAARDQRAEIGEAGVEPPLLPPGPPRNASPATTATRGSIFFIAASLGDHVRAAALMAAMATHLGWSAMKLVRVHDDDALLLSATLFDGLDLGKGVITLDCAEAAHDARQGELKRKFGLVMDKTLPRAVIVFDGSQAVLACGEVARSMGVPIARIGTGRHFDPSRAAETGGPKSTEQLADLWYATDEQAAQALARQGVPPTRIRCAGDLLVDAVQMALRSLRDPMLCGAFHRMVIPLPSEGGRYALVLIDDPTHIGDRQSAVALIALLRRISRSIAMVLLMRSDVEHEFNKHGFNREIFGERMCHLPAQAYPNHVELLRNATCALTDSPDARQEAVALRIPCLAIGIRTKPAFAAPVRSNATQSDAPALATWAVWQDGPDSAIRDDVPDLCDGLTGARIAEHLCAWLNTSKYTSARLVTEENRQKVHVSAYPFPPA